jgi:hypothetical protein
LLRNYFAKITKRRIRRENPFHAETPFENGSGGVDEKSSPAACKPVEKALTPRFSFSFDFLPANS